MQIQITKIDNGYLVATPGVQSKINPNQGTAPTVQYCANFTAVVNVLKELWPDEVDYEAITQLK